MQKTLQLLVLTGFTVLFASCGSTKRTVTTGEGSKKIPVQQEFRAAWIATVANINWPAKPGLSTEEQKKDAIALLDFLQQHHFNAAILQVRPQCDALYESKLEPWSYFLTGKQGQPPSPYYDPLEFWTEEAHNRGIELHVWLNPYRAHHKDGKEISDQSIIKKKPELALYLKEGYWWLDPAHPGTQEHSTAVVMDLVRRYDIDGVHFDDYFYPYPSYNEGADFPDTASWDRYRQLGGTLSRADWRRKAVNDFIENLYHKIKAEKDHVKFGLSPFGIWRPGHPESAEGFDQYEQLYADAKLWLNKGWIDYFTPQLYWPISRQAQSFPVLLAWWQQENHKQRHLWPGMSVSRDTSIKSVQETINQIMITRAIVPDSKGAVHWSISSLVRNPALAKALLDGPYKKQAIVPASPWLQKRKSVVPGITVSVADSTVFVSRHSDAAVFRWVLYFQYENQKWDYIICNRYELSHMLPLLKINNGKNSRLRQVAVSVIDRSGNESDSKAAHIQSR